MSSEKTIDDRNRFWRRITERLSRVNVSRLVRSFQSVITCGKSREVVNSPIYTGPKITVPWTGEPFQYPEDRYLSNDELRSQLNLLEMRFYAQSRRFDDSRNEERRKIKMTKAAKVSDEQFSRIRDMVAELQENGMVNNPKASIVLK